MMVRCRETRQRWVRGEWGGPSPAAHDSPGSREVSGGTVPETCLSPPGGILGNIISHWPRCSNVFLM